MVVSGLRVTFKGYSMATVKTAVRAKKRVASSPNKKKDTAKSVILKTAIFFILDETGSMASVRDSVISGYNEFISGLKKDKERLNDTLTLVKFNLLDNNVFFGIPVESNSGIRKVFENKKIADLDPFTRDDYDPNFITPLYDAIGITLKAVDLENLGADRALCAIYTDGLENASKEFKRDDIFKLIESLKATGKWTFVFMGANQDSYIEGGKIGITANTMNYQPTPAGTRHVFASFTSASQAYRVSDEKSSEEFWHNKTAPKRNLRG